MIGVMKYVLIGNSAAAIGCIEGIRKSDVEGEITVISDECHHTYSRPLISYYLEGKTSSDNMLYRPKDFYDVNKVDTRLGIKAVKINPNDKKVSLEDGSMISYDKLLVATGSSPFVPPVNGIEKTGYHTFMSYDDALNIKDSLKPGEKVVILGAGLIGLKAAEGLYKHTTDITVIDLAPRILSSILDDDGAAIVMRHLEGKGIKFVLGVSASQVDIISDKSNENKTITLSDGTSLSFDRLICAVGVRGNIQLAKECGVNVGRGIITDDAQLTNIDDVFAAGDCTESLDTVSGEQRVLALLPNAYIQGYVAGENMSSERQMKYGKAIAMNAIGFFGLHIICAGNVAFGDVNIVENDGENYRRIAIKDSVVKGYILIGEVRNAGIYTNLIREQERLSAEQIEMLAQTPSLLMYDEAARRRML